MICTIHRLSSLFLVFIVSATISILDATEFPGTLPGSVVVDNRGSASYSIPIEVVPGTGGVEPKLKLQYSSMAGNGYVGNGWVLGGLSSISRIPTNDFFENGNPLNEGAYDPSNFKNYGVDFSSSDRFALDGQRLVVVNGAHGADGSKYRTEIDQFAQVTANGSTGNGPTSFTVTTKDGLIMTFGGSANSRVVDSNNNVLIWALSEVKDTAKVANRFTVTYVNSGGEFRPDEIIYSADNICSVEFIYVDNKKAVADQAPSYLAGVKMVNTERLTSIVAKEDGEIIRSYNLTYEESVPSGMSRLKSVSVLSAGDTVPATVFDWTERGSNSYSTQKPANTDGYDLGPWYSYDDATVTKWVRARNALRKPTKANVWLLDIDGDGIQEFGKGYIQDFNNEQFIRQIYKYDTSTHEYAVMNVFSNAPVWQATENPRTNSTTFADFNGDGKSDMLVHYLVPDPNGPDPKDIIEDDKGCFNFTEEATVVYFAQSNGTYDVNAGVSVDTYAYMQTSTTRGELLVENESDENAADDESELPFILTGDMNGDGRADIVKLLELPEVESQHPSTASWRDFANDPNRIFFQVFLSDGTTFHNGDPEGDTTIWGNYVEFNDSRKNRRISLVDMNGDGMSDLFVVCENSAGNAVAKVFYSNGGGFEANGSDTINMPDWGDTTASHFPADVNGDGLTDIVYFHMMDPSDDDPDVHVETYLSTGKGFTAACHFEEEDWENEYRPMVVDVNGDGKSDLVLMDKNNGDDRLRIYFAHGNPDPDGNSTTPDAIFATSPVDIQLGFDYSDQASYLPTDVDADGIMDFIRLDRDGGSDQHNAEMLVALVISDASKADLLKTVTNGLGAVTELTYAPLTDPTVYDVSLPENPTECSYPYLKLYAPYYVVRTLGKDDGIGSAGGDYITQYRYGEGYLHRWGRGFLGFRKFTSTDMRKGSKKHELLNYAFPYTGMTLKSWTEVKNSGGTLVTVSQVVNTVGYKKTTAANTYFPYFSQSTETNTEPDGPTFAKTVTKNQFDDFGNNTQIVVNKYRLEGGSLVEDSELITGSHFGPTDTDRLLGRLEDTTVNSSYRNVDGTTVSSVKTSKFTYYPDTYLLKSEVIEPDNALELTTTYVYGDHGNLLQKTLTGDKIGIGTRYTIYKYDGSGRYPIRVTNPYSQYTESIYDKPGFGLPTTTYGVNRLVSTVTYNGFGDAIMTVAPDGTTTSTSSSRSTDEDAPDNMAYKVTTTTFNNGVELAPPTKQFFDRLGREIRSVTYNGDVQKIYVDTVYNSLGQVEKTSEPYFANTNADASPEYWNQSTYDSLNRPKDLTKDIPDGSILSRYIYDGFTTTLTQDVGGKNQSTTTVVDAKGQKIKVTDNNGKTMKYVYDASGNLLQTVDSVGKAVTMGYNIRGFKTEMDDPDMGHWVYSYNEVGELLTQVDAAGNKTTLTYDVLGRMIQREVFRPDDLVTAEEYASWTYNNAETPLITPSSASIGKLIKEYGEGGYSKKYDYDNKGRVIVSTETISNTEFSTQTYYDTHGRLSKIVYPSGKSVNNGYGAYSFVNQVIDSENHIWWSGVGDYSDYDAYGRLVQYRYGHNNLKSSLTYEASTGYLTEVQSWSNMEDTPQQFAAYRYEYDHVGNVTRRQDELRNFSENFGYDGLNRLTHVNDAQVVTYDDLGNITSKVGVGAYAYDLEHHHQVTSAGGIGYQYDLNGNITKRGSNSIWWTAFNKTRSIFGESGAGYTFYYDAGHHRVLETVMAGETYWNKFFVGGLYEEEHRDGKIEKRHYIPTPAGVIGVWLTSTDGTQSREYMVNDHLGSSSLVVREDGSTVSEYSYDAWGNPRNPDNWAVGLSDWPDYLANRGYTGHEMLEEIKLVHMNARIYDPVLGRFLSPDTYVQFEYNMQSYNRYSYVINNPMRYTDPSGNFIFTLAAIAYAATANTIEWYVAAAIFAVAGAADALVNGATIGHALQAGAIAAATSMIGSAIGGYFSEAEWFTEFSSGAEKMAMAIKAAAHGLAQGAFSDAIGGNFGSAFASGFVGNFGGQYASSLAGGNHNVGLLVAAVAGGTASEIGGGKFGNGALTAAMTYVVNDMAHDGSKDKSKTKTKTVTIMEEEEFIVLFKNYGSGIDAFLQLFDGEENPMYLKLGATHYTKIDVPNDWVAKFENEYEFPVETWVKSYTTLDLTEIPLLSSYTGGMSNMPGMSIQTFKSWSCDGVGRYKSITNSMILNAVKDAGLNINDYDYVSRRTVINATQYGPNFK